MDFDIKTILVNIIIGHIFILILLLSYKFTQGKNKYIGTFILGRSFQTLAWILIIFRGQIPDIYSITLANSVFFAGIALETAAIMIVIGVFTKAVRNFYIIATIVFILVSNYFTFLQVNESLRIVVFSVASTTYMLFTASELFRNKTKSTFRVVLAILFTIVSICSLARGASAFINGFGIFSNNLFQLFSFEATYLFMIVGSIGFVLLSKEIADIELIRAASTDYLTGALNRRSFIEQAVKSIAFFVRKNGPVSFLLLDVDDFKRINDENDHVTGDAVLREFAVKIREQLRAYDLFGRYGGDEFAMFLPGVDEKGSDEVAERLRKLVQGTKSYGTIPISFTISIGVLTVVPDATTDIDTLYRLVDNALYRAKLNGKNRVERSKLY